MADKKISELDAITGANTAATDVFVVVDTSTGQTKKITREELNNAIERDVLDSIDIDTINGDFTVNGNINLGDNNKAIFGAGSDLQIYHDGSNSYVQDAGTGDLILKGAGSVLLKSAADEVMLHAIGNGAVKLNYDNSTKLATTSTGIDVTGKVSSDGLEVDLTSSGDVELTGAVNSTAGLVVRDPTASAYGAHFSYDDANTVVSIGGKTLGTKNTAITIHRDSNDISFYEDTGTTAKLFWDSSAENLGLGTTSPDRAIKIHKDNAYVWIADAAGGNVAFMGGSGENDGLFRLYEGGGHTAKVEIHSDADSYFNGGNVGIGTSSPYDALTVDTANGILNIANGNTSGGTKIQAWGATPSNGYLAIEGYTKEYMRIDSSGNVLVGTTDALPASNNDANGFALRADGNFQASRSGAACARLNRGTSDGEIMSFHKDGSTVGSIGVEGGDNFYITDNNNTGLNMKSGLIIPCNTNGSTRDNAIDLGASGGRFKALYLSGDVVLGAADGYVFGNTNGVNIRASSGKSTIFDTAGTERMRIDSSGNVLVGTSDTTLYNNSGSGNGGIALSIPSAGAGRVDAARAGTCYTANRLGSNGMIFDIRKDGTTVGSIGTSGQVYIAGTAHALKFFSLGVQPANSSGSNTDNSMDIGTSSTRFDDIYATNGTIQTSDQNEKQQIASLTDAEITAAKAISKLFKTFKWNDKVEAKGDAARTHTGVIAQDVQQAMTDAGLDAGDYAFFISTTWWETQTEVPAVEADEENGIEAADAYTRTDTYDTAEEAPEGATERTRLGIRYPELLSFIGAATEQRLADIETRLTTLEGN